MNIIFSDHALLKLEQRGLSREKVIQAVRVPEYVFPSYADRMLAYKKFDKLYLRVVFTREKGSIVIITQYWDEDFKPASI